MLRSATSRAAASRRFCAASSCCSISARDASGFFSASAASRARRRRAHSTALQAPPHRLVRCIVDVHALSPHRRKNSKRQSARLRRIAPSPANPSAPRARATGAAPARRRSCLPAHTTTENRAIECAVRSYRWSPRSRRARSAAAAGSDCRRRSSSCDRATRSRRASSDDAAGDSACACGDARRSRRVIAHDATDDHAPATATAAATATAVRASRPAPRGAATRLLDARPGFGRRIDLTAAPAAAACADRCCSSRAHMRA